MKTLVVFLCVTSFAVSCLMAAHLDPDEIQFLMREMLIAEQRSPSSVHRFSIDQAPVAVAEHDVSNLRSCSCQDTTCGCCVHMEVERIHLNDTVCLNMSYLPKEIGVEVALILDGKVLFSEKVSAKNPPPICADVPYLKKLASLCLRLYNLDFDSSSVSGCAEIEARLAGMVLEKFDLGCFKFPLGGSLPRRPELELP